MRTLCFFAKHVWDNDERKFELPEPVISLAALAAIIVYGFQVQAVGNEGVTGWSDASTHMSM